MSDSFEFHIARALLALLLLTFVDDRLQIEYVPSGSIRPHPRNPRKHSPEQLAMIAKSVSEFGCRHPLTVDLDGYIVAGNGRYIVYTSFGYTEIPIQRAQFRGETSIAFMIADNRSSELSEWDYPVLRDHMSELDGTGYNLDVIGYDEKHAEAVLTWEAEPEEPAAPKPTEPPPDAALAEQSTPSYTLLVECGSPRVLDDLMAELKERGLASKMMKPKRGGQAE